VKKPIERKSSGEEDDLKRSSSSIHKINRIESRNFNLALKNSDNILLKNPSNKLKL
jgi:hypothetical protein